MYALGNDEFISLNMELIKVINNPQIRANLHRDYVAKALDYFHGII